MIFRIASFRYVTVAVYGRKEVLEEAIECLI